MALQRLSRPKGGEKADELVGILVAELLNASVLTHKLHLKVSGTGSYAQHIALNEFYDAIKDGADSLAEQYQGHKMIILDTDKALMDSYILTSVDDCLDYLEKLYNLISEVQSMMTCSSIINEMDTLKSTINTAKYKLNFLN
jgi:DNA-binding ferritin-like protein